MSSTTRSELRAVWDSEAGSEANYEHLLTMFEGYRDANLARDSNEKVKCEHPVGSAKFLAWKYGFDMYDDDVNSTK